VLPRSYKRLWKWLLYRYCHTNFVLHEGSPLFDAGNLSASYHTSTIGAAATIALNNVRLSNAVLPAE
jgi:hypothetical protein